MGEIATIRRGITTRLRRLLHAEGHYRRGVGQARQRPRLPQHAGGAPRDDVESGKLRIIKAGDGSVHAIEAEYLAPEVHSLMKVDRPVVRAADVDRVVLLVAEPMDELKAKSPWVWRYLRYGMTATFPSSKSKPVPMPKRSTCEGRDPWYNLTGLVRPGIAFWPMAQQYRHIIAANPERLICNHNLFDLAADRLKARERAALVAVLNSTVVGLFKTFYGRYAGTEGNLKTEVVDVNLLDVPDPRGVSADVAKRLADALQRMGKRDVGRLVEEQLMDCHTPERARRLAAGPLVLSNELQQPDRRDLDDAVLELLGVSDAAERADLIGRLYEATARHFREIRVVEIEKMEQRCQGQRQAAFALTILAADIWDAAELEDAKPLADWVAQQPESDSLVVLLEERPATLSNDLMFLPNTVYFGKGRKGHVDCQSRGQAELAARLANLGVVGQVKLPAELAPALKVLDRVDRRVERAHARSRNWPRAEPATSGSRANLWNCCSAGSSWAGQAGKADATAEEGQG